MDLLQQTTEAPLFPELLWSKPENKFQAGKLLIIGGNSFGFSAVGDAYECALKAGAGEIKVLLPVAIQKIVGGVFEHALFAPSNRSGGFSKDALNTCLEAAQWADAVLIIGDVSRNTETAAMLEQFCESYKGRVTVTKDALELLLKPPAPILGREHTNLVMTLSNLQQATRALKFPEALTFESSLQVFAERLSAFTQETEANYIIKRNEFIFVSSKSHLSVTSVPDDESPWRVRVATSASVWDLQNPGKTFEALSTSVLQ